MTDFTIGRQGNWLGGVADVDDATFGELIITITVGPSRIPVTEVDDTIAMTTRPVIRVPMIRVAEWFALNWWRLRWESRPNVPGIPWRQAHSMAAIGGGIPWPPLEIWSDGEFVHLAMESEARPDVAAVRYIRHVPGLEIPARAFEQGVDAFLELVDARAQAAVGYSTLGELRAELHGERSDPKTAQQCRWQARAGIDPGEASEAWLAAVAGAAREAGRLATEEILAAVGSDVRRVTELLAAVRASLVTADLSAGRRLAVPVDGEAPWKRGVRAAQAARAALGIENGPVDDGKLESVLGLRLPMPVNAPPGDLAGGFRDNGDDVTRVLVRQPRLTSQRFYLARLLGTAACLGREEHLLAVSDATTSAQRFGRAFAQEFLCPWKELDALTDEEGTGEDAILTIAERYRVSEMLVTTTLVNRGKVEREQLARFAG